jgi:hypothetical protein
MGTKKDDSCKLQKSSFSLKVVFCLVSTKRGTDQIEMFFCSYS